MTASPAPYLAIGLSQTLVVQALSDPSAFSAVNEGAAFTVVGIDRVSGSPSSVDFDASVAAAQLAHTPDTAILVAASVHHDHPYNLARRVASLDHLSGGRTGLLLGTKDIGAFGDVAWGGAALGGEAPLSAETAADAATAITALWRSWPVESIVADRTTGIYARSEQIRRTRHDGAFRIAGPLTVPTTVQGAPVLAWFGEDAPAAADLIIGPRATGPSSFREVTVVDAHEHPEADGASGLLLVPETRSLSEAISILRGIRAAVSFRSVDGATLRERLDIPFTDIVPDAAEPAFPEPTPLR